MRCWPTIQRLARFASSTVLLILQYALGGAIFATFFLLPFSLIGWICTGDFSFFAVTMPFWALMGALFGVGSLITEMVRPPTLPEPDGESDGVAKIFAIFYGGKLLDLVPGSQILTAFNVILWFVSKDFSAQRPGRWKRAVAGGLAGAFGGFAFAAVPFLVLDVPQSSDALSYWQAALCLGGMGCIGLFIAGALSDSW